MTRIAVGFHLTRRDARIGRSVRAAHNSIPLRLRHLELSHLEPFGDPHPVHRALRIDADARAHQKLTGSDLHEPAPIQQGLEAYGLMG